MRVTKKVMSAVLHGVDAELVSIEVSVSGGLPGINIVGLREESKYRIRELVRAALQSAKFSVPGHSVTINVTPECKVDDDSGLDLAIAMGILRATGQIQTPEDDIYVYVGTLGLDGAVKSVRGMPSYVRLTESCGYQFVGGSPYVTPDGTALLPDTGSIQQMPGSAFDQLYFENLASLHESTLLFECERVPRADVIAPDLENVLSNAEKEALREAIVDRKCRVVEVTNASAQELVSIARYINYLLGDMSDVEILETAMNRSAAGQSIESTLSGERPIALIVPSQTLVGVIGGGNPIKPGLLNLAHNGVAILEDINAFRSATITGIRAAFDQKKSHLVRSTGSYVIPCDNVLIINEYHNFCNSITPSLRSRNNAQAFHGMEGGVKRVRLKSAD